MNQSAAAAVARASQLDQYYRWVEPDSDITVCLSLATMDRLQAVVLRSVDSLSHDGREVGGILLGRTERDGSRTLLFVDDFEPVACDHANGPAYALTAKDEAQFAAALARAGAREGPAVVGYYRSHNRKGLFLSADDLRLIQRHFSGPDNLFLLVKASANTACTAGFFFWKHGRIQNEFTDSEVPFIPTALSSGTAADSSPDPVLRTREEPAAIALATVGRRRDVPRQLVSGLALFAAAAAVTFAALVYWEKQPAPPGPVIPGPAVVNAVTPVSYASPVARTFVGPVVIQQVIPFVPRDIERKITTDVQVEVAVIIDANGTVTSALVASTKGAAAGLLTTEALKAAQSFRFRPARTNNADVPSSTVLTFRFPKTAK
jgi:TonB family protein